MRHKIYFFQYKKQITLNDPKSAAMGFSHGLKKEFETAVVNEPSVFETLKFYCILRWPKWLTFHFHTTSQFRIPKFALRISEFGIVKYI